MPDDRAALTRCVITGASTGRRKFRRLAGIGSKAQEAFEDLRITVIISETVVGLNICNLDLDAVSKLFKGGQAMTVAEDSHVDSKHQTNIKQSKR